MDHTLCRALLGLSLSCLPSRGAVLAQTVTDTIRGAIESHQFDLSGDGQRFLIDEATRNQFILLGELHGDREIPELLRRLWPQLWKQGYHQIAAEVSPWAAHQLEMAPERQGSAIRGTWTRMEAARVHAVAEPGRTVLWGCDMEEPQPDRLIQELVHLNPKDSDLQRMASMTSRGYRRDLAPRLLDLASSRGVASRDRIVNDISLRQSLLATLRIETDRLNRDNRMIAQEERERLMKQQFLAHVRQSGGSKDSPGKVFFRFGRNHLHRGYDARGVSTLGNFIAELATEHGSTAFNVGAFGAGGKAALLGQTWTRMNERTSRHLRCLPRRRSMRRRSLISGRSARYCTGFLWRSDPRWKAT